MTTIVSLPQTVPTSRDLNGLPEQAGTSDGGSATPDGAGGSFTSLLSDLSQPVTSTVAAASASIAAPLASEGFNRLAGDDPSAASTHEADMELTDLATSLASLARGTSKSGIRPNSLASQATPQSDQDGASLSSTSSLSPSLASLKAAAGQVTGLLGRIAEDAHSASASATKQAARSNPTPRSGDTKEPASKAVTGQAGTDASVSEQVTDKIVSEASDKTDKTTLKGAEEAADPASKTSATDRSASSSSTINSFVPIAVATMAGNAPQMKGQAGHQPLAGSTGGGMRRLRAGAVDDTSTAKQPVSSDAVASQAMAVAIPIAGAPPTPLLKADAPVDAVASRTDRPGQREKAAQSQTADLSLSTALDDATSAKAPVASQRPNEMKVTVLSSATHFAPVARLSPVQQISGALTASLPALQGGRSGAVTAEGNSTGAPSFQASPDDLGLTAQAPAAAIKTLNLQLQPENLGQVTIKLNLSDNGLLVQLEAAHQQTADLIDRDRQTLTQKLAQSGYAVAGVEVTATSSQASHLANDHSSPQGQADANAGQSGGQASGFGGSSNGERQAHDSAAFGETQRTTSKGVANDGAAARTGPGDSRELFV